MKIKLIVSANWFTTFNEGNNLMKKSSSKRGRPSTKNMKTAGSKQPTALQKAREAQKTMRTKLASLKKEFKHKLQTATKSAYEKALADALQLQEKKADAKSKLLAAVEAKFEKKYTKKAGKPAKAKHGKRGKKSSDTNAIPKNTSMTHGKKSRGRPRKAA